MKIRYYIEFKLLPDMLFENFGHFIGSVLSRKGAGLYDVYEQSCNELNIQNPYTEKDFSVDPLPCGNDCFLFRIKMPIFGLVSPFCRIVYVTIDGSRPDETALHYITLEYENESTNFLGEVLKDGTHICYGTAKNDEKLILSDIFKIGFFSSNVEDFFTDRNVIASHNPITMTLRQFVERICIPHAFFSNEQALLDKITEDAGNTMTSIFDVCYNAYNKESPYCSRDFSFYSVDIEKTSNKTNKLFIVNMPYDTIIPGDSVQIVFAQLGKRYKYFSIEYNDEKAYLYEVHEGIYIRRGEVPQDRNSYLCFLIETANSN